jgi:hypothetical protein
MSCRVTFSSGNDQPTPAPGVDVSDTEERYLTTEVQKDGREVNVSRGRMRALEVSFTTTISETNLLLEIRKKASFNAVITHGVDRDVDGAANHVDIALTRYTRLKPVALIRHHSAGLVTLVAETLDPPTDEAPGEGDGQD